MKRFSIWYSEDNYGKVGFDAESLEDAIALIEQVKGGDITLEDLPNYWKKDKGGDFSLGDLEEIA